MPHPFLGSKWVMVTPDSFRYNVNILLYKICTDMAALTGMREAMG